MSSEGSDQLQSPDGCPTGEGLITPTAGLDRGRRTSVNSVVSARAACEGPASTPLQQHSLVGDRGRANHPPVMPVQQGSRTQVSMVGNLGKSLTAHSLSSARARKRGPATPLSKIAAKSFTKVDCKPAARPARLSPQQTEAQPVQKLPLSDRSPRVEERRLTPVDLPVAVEPPQRPLLRR